MQLSTASLNTLGGRIKAARVARGLTQAVVIERLGISRVSLNSWEKNAVKSPDIHQLLEFTKLCDVDIGWLLERKGGDPFGPRAAGAAKQRRTKEEEDALNAAYEAGWNAAMQLVKATSEARPKRKA